MREKSFTGEDPSVPRPRGIPPGPGRGTELLPPTGRVHYKREYDSGGNVVDLTVAEDRFTTVGSTVTIGYGLQTGNRQDSEALSAELPIGVKAPDPETPFFKAIYSKEAKVVSLNLVINLSPTMVQRRTSFITSALRKAGLTVAVERYGRGPTQGVVINVDGTTTLRSLEVFARDIEPALVGESPSLHHDITTVMRSGAIGLDEPLEPMFTVMGLGLSSSSNRVTSVREGVKTVDQIISEIYGMYTVAFESEVGVSQGVGVVSSSLGAAVSASSSYGHNGIDPDTGQTFYRPTGGNNGTAAAAEAQFDQALDSEYGST